MLSFGKMLHLTVLGNYSDDSYHLKIHKLMRTSEKVRKELPV